jgi:uncharacterized membrane protein YgcG
VAAGSSHEVSGGLTPRQQERIEHALAAVRSENGLDISVLVGDLELTDLQHFRGGCERLHAALGERSASAVLVVVAPGQRLIEIVTGEAVRHRVPDRVCGLAVLSMTSAFTGGDLTGGVVDGVRQIADAAGRRAALSPIEDKRTDLAHRSDPGHSATGHAAPVLHSGGASSGH